MEQQIQINQTFESVLYLHSIISPEHIPYEHKYKARKMLQELKTKVEDIAILGIIDYYLGINYIDTEENSQAYNCFKNALNSFSKLDNPYNYLTYVQTIYNHLGFIELNKDENEKGLGILVKAESLGQWLLQQDIPQTINFNYHFEGGLQKSKIDAAYTITLFYLAQGYTKLGLKDQGAYYCGLTMQRQFESKNYQLKDWCVNCVSLSEYYYQNNNFSQALYLLQSGESVLPKDKKKKLQKLNLITIIFRRATFQMSLGKVLHEFMNYCILKILQKKQHQEDLALNEQKVQFQGINAQFLVFYLQFYNLLKKLTCKKNYDEAKSLFRQANTSYKKALEYFVIDGYVTEHIQIIQDISQMYKNLSKLEDDILRVIAMLDKRLELLEPIYKAINPKAYENTWQQLLVEMADIYNEYYELINQKELLGDNVPNKKRLEKMNNAANKAINFYQQIEQILLADDKADKTEQYFQSIVNAKFNISKALSKLFSPDKKEKVKLMAESLKSYKQMVEFIENEIWGKFPQLGSKYREEHKMCLEMVQLLPSKIDKINNS